MENDAGRYAERYSDKKTVSEILGIIEQGVTCPVKCRMSDGLNAIVKYQRNPCGTAVLINEWIGNSIADLIGLTIPGYGICDLSESVIQETNANEEIDERNSGTAFFSQLIGNSVPPTRLQLRNAYNKETERLILFDHLIKNEDRHKGNFLYVESKPGKVSFIDCSHFLTVRGSLYKPLDLNKELSIQSLQDMRLLSNSDRNCYDLLCETVGYREDRLFEEADHIRNLITEERLQEIWRSIPAEWMDDEPTQKRVDNVFRIIQYRASNLDTLSGFIAQERRKRKWKKY